MHLCVHRMHKNSLSIVIHHYISQIYINNESKKELKITMAEPKAYPLNPTIGPYISGPERFMKSKEERRSGLPRIYVRACIRKRGVEGECRINSALYAITHKTPLRLYSHLLRKFPYGNAHTTNPINFILITASSSTRRLLLFRRRRID